MALDCPEVAFPDFGNISIAYTAQDNQDTVDGNTQTRKWNSRVFRLAESGQNSSFFGLSIYQEYYHMVPNFVAKYDIPTFGSAAKGPNFVTNNVNGITVFDSLQRFNQIVPFDIIASVPNRHIPQNFVCVYAPAMPAGMRREGKLLLTNGPAIKDMNDNLWQQKQKGNPEWDITENVNGASWERLLKVVPKGKKGDKSVIVYIDEKNCQEVFGRPFEHVTSYDINKFGGGKLWQARDKGKSQVCKLSEYDEWIKNVDIEKEFVKKEIGKNEIESVLAIVTENSDQYMDKKGLIEELCIKLSYNYLVDKWINGSKNNESMGEEKHDDADDDDSLHAQLTENKEVIVVALMSMDSQLDYISELKEMASEWTLRVRDGSHGWTEVVDDAVKANSKVIEKYGYSGTMSPFGSSTLAQYHRSGSNIGDLAKMIVYENDIIPEQLRGAKESGFEYGVTDDALRQYMSLFPLADIE